MNYLAILAPVLGVVALLFAASLSAKVSKQDAGTDRMKEISAFIHEGAQAFLFSEYKILVVFVAVLFVGIGLGIENGPGGLHCVGVEQHSPRPAQGGQLRRGLNGAPRC